MLISYLSHRKQFVQVSHLISNQKAIVAGVPQGSILGPLLFNLYINDIVCISSDLKFVIYADDTSIFVPSSSCADAFVKGNIALKKLEAWTDSNQLNINTKKNKSSNFSP